MKYELVDWKLIGLENVMEAANKMYNTFEPNAITLYMVRKLFHVNFNPYAVPFFTPITGNTPKHCAITSTVLNDS